MSSPILFSRLISRISRLPTQPFFVPRQNFISITVDNEFVKQSEKQLKEENEQAEVDVSEFGSDPYPFWRKEHLKRKEDRFQGARRKKGAVSIRKVRGLVELINFKRDNQYQ